MNVSGQSSPGRQSNFAVFNLDIFWGGSPKFSVPLVLPNLFLEKRHLMHDTISFMIVCKYI